MIKVIFVCGVNHSGTTMLDVMLSNGNDKAISCGELYGVKHRSNIRKTFYLTVRNAMNKGKNIYQFIYRSTNKNIIIDSSKFPDWINEQHGHININDHVRYYNVVIYKTPIELGYSYYKRNQLDIALPLYSKWNFRYLKYNNSIFIRYNDLVLKSAKTLKCICNFTGVQYFNGKERFWEGGRPSLAGGCTQVMWNWLKKDSKSYEKRLNRIVDTQGRNRSEVNKLRDKHCALYYDDSWKKMPKDIQDQIWNYPGIREVFDKLELRREIIK